MRCCAGSAPSPPPPCLHARQGPSQNLCDAGQEARRRLARLRHHACMRRRNQLKNQCNAAQEARRRLRHHACIRGRVQVKIHAMPGRKRAVASATMPACAAGTRSRSMPCRAGSAPWPRPSPPPCLHARQAPGLNRNQSQYHIGIKTLAATPHDGLPLQNRSTVRRTVAPPTATSHRRAQWGSGRHAHCTLFITIMLPVAEE